jgi:hypothetical protein
MVIIRFLSTAMMNASRMINLRTGSGAGGRHRDVASTDAGERFER